MEGQMDKSAFYFRYCLVCASWEVVRYSWSGGNLLSPYTHFILESLWTLLLDYLLKYSYSAGLRDPP